MVTFSPNGLLATTSMGGGREVSDKHGLGGEAEVVFCASRASLRQQEQAGASRAGELSGSRRSFPR